MRKENRKIIGWIVYIIGLFLMMETTDTFMQAIQLIFGSILVIEGNKIINKYSQYNGR